MRAVTRAMISAAHAITLEGGQIVLSAELLERIYLAMRAREPLPRISWACPVCGASVDRAEDEGAKQA